MLAANMARTGQGGQSLHRAVAGSQWRRVPLAGRWCLRSVGISSIGMVSVQYLRTHLFVSGSKVLPAAHWRAWMSGERADLWPIWVTL